jgi:predicted nuclease with TOPRIM domain
MREELPLMLFKPFKPNKSFKLFKSFIPLNSSKLFKKSKSFKPSDPFRLSNASHPSIGTHPYHVSIRTIVILVSLLLLLILSSVSLIRAAGTSGQAPVVPPIPDFPSDAEMLEILGQSLTVTELNKEIDRIAERQAQTEALQAETEALRAQQQALTEQKLSQSGEVLRAYYKGERNVWFSALFAAESVNDLLRSLDYFNLVFTNDRQALDDYAARYQELESTLTTLAELSASLTDMREQFTEQRDRLVALEEEMEERIGALPEDEQERMRVLIEETNQYWETYSYVEIQRYFAALSDAMENLADWILSSKNSDMVSFTIAKYTLTVPQERLKEFLMEQNSAVFNDFSMTFEEDVVSFVVDQGDLHVKITGHYSLQDEPINGIIFNVDTLDFNGLSLPDTTRAQLEEDWDLGFYPSLIMPNVIAKDVQVTDGKLIVVLGWDF